MPGREQVRSHTGTRAAFRMRSDGVRSVWGTDLRGHGSGVPGLSAAMAEGEEKGDGLISRWAEAWKGVGEGPIQAFL